MYFMGLDVGYSNLKVAGGAARNMTIHERLPAGAGPAADLDESLGGNQTSGVDVDVRGQSWVAGVEPSGFASPRERSIPTTRRLVHADAECADRSVVIATGVRAMPVIVMQPVRQMRRALIRILVGAGIRHSWSAVWISRSALPLVRGRYGRVLRCLSPSRRHTLANTRER